MTTRYFTCRLSNGEPVTVARVMDGGRADRVTRASAPEWKPYPKLAYLAVWNEDMSWDEVTADEADRFVKEMKRKQEPEHLAPAHRCARLPRL